MKGTLIVDDHPLFRQGLRAALESAGGFEPFSEAGSVLEAKSVLDAPEPAGSHGPALVVLDIGLPDAPGFALLEDRAGIAGGPRFFMLSMHRERAVALKALRSGADGYASKEITLEALILALRLVLSGQGFVEIEILRELLTYRSPREDEESAARESIATLSAREREAFLLIAEGRGAKELASSLGVSLRSAENYRSAIYRKLEIQSAAAVARLAIRAGLIKA
ncbi:MAG: response regulator transcription factor [Spirochaetales bacterium]|nr:response regulator transcription factor [Spirochaetales bacterium]